MPSQSDVIEFVRSELQPEDVVTTHVSTVFIGKDRVLKLKRRVKFPFLDFRTLKARKEACAREVEINRRTAPEIYQGVVTVTEAADGTLALDGAGTPVDCLVDMVPFDQSTLFDRLTAEEGGLRRRMIESLADEIARFHDAAPVVEARGGYTGIRAIAENNAASFERLDRESFSADLVAEVTSQTLVRIDAAKEILETRRLSGRVRECHGDLHCRNICLFDGRPMLFDAIEFSPDFSEIDVMYDLAFLLMDLEFRGHRRLASILLNRYLEVGTETSAAFAVLPIFLSMRAQIRAHVGAAIAAAQDDAGRAESELSQARRYLDLSAQYLSPPVPALVAVGGLSGSGKSRLARELAPHVGAAPGARVVRTDVVRKRLAGVHPNDRLGPEGYTNDMTEKTYAAFASEAAETLAAGHSVIMDAVFAHADQRATAAKIASSAGVPFIGIWVDAPEEVRVARVQERTNNVSDANADIAKGQSSYDLGEMTWHVVDSAGSKDETVEAARALFSSFIKGEP